MTGYVYAAPIPEPWVTPCVYAAPVDPKPWKWIPDGIVTPTPIPVSPDTDNAGKLINRLKARREWLKRMLPEMQVELETIDKMLEALDRA